MGGHRTLRGVCAAVAVTVVLGVWPAAADSASDEAHIRSVLDAMNTSYNRSDFDGFAAHLCRLMLNSPGIEEDWRASRSADGPTRITVSSVRLAGERAVATVRFEAVNHEDAEILVIDFVREAAQWKACRYRVPRSV